MTGTLRSVRPTLETVRLILRPFALSDAAEVQRLAGAREVAATTLTMPHPYEDGMAEAWIGTHQEDFEKGKGLTFAITLRQNGALVGAISLGGISRQHQRAEIGYWIGLPYWNRGYCTEAARAALRYGFEALGLERIFGEHFTRNPASGRIMRKLGMTHEGCLRKHVKRWDVFEDLQAWGILKSEWKQRPPDDSPRNEPGKGSPI
jgi:ribosomal-protein-alanine N-acetyltransferase